MTGDGKAKYGRLLSADEYDRRVTRVHDRALEEAGSSAARAELDRRVRALEVDLAIDRRLGVDFPREKRLELLQVRDRVEKERRRLTFRMLRGRISRAQFAQVMQDIVKSMVADLSSGLTEEELKAFLGIPDPDSARLPLDPDQVDPESRGRS